MSSASEKACQEQCQQTSSISTSSFGTKLVCVKLETHGMRNMTSVPRLLFTALPDFGSLLISHGWTSILCSNILATRRRLHDQSKEVNHQMALSQECLQTRLWSSDHVHHS